MQVNSVSLSSDAAKRAFGATPEEHLFANLKDRDVRQLAWAKASQDVNDRKHRRIDNALFYALPIAGGLAASVRELSPEAIARFGKQNVRAIKLGRFGLVTAAWAAGLAALGALWGAKDYLAKKVDLIKNNPVISSVVTFAAGFGVLAAVNRGGSKLLIKALNSVDDKKVVPHLRKIRNALNNSKILDKISEFSAKVPSPIKDIGKGAAELAPLLVIGTQIAHLFSHQRVKAQVANRNYEEFKQAQEIIKDDIVNEKIEKSVHKKSIADLHAEYEQMLQTKPIINAQTKEPVTFEEFVKLATTLVK